MDVPFESYEGICSAIFLVYVLKQTIQEPGLVLGLQQIISSITKNNSANFQPCDFAETHIIGRDMLACLVNCHLGLRCIQIRQNVL